jgi:3-oxoadipate enol-lactonase
MQRSVNGVRLNVIDEGEGHPILFLHGLGGSWRDWEPQLDALRDRHRVIVLDHRGHGRSEVTRGDYRVELFAADAVALCRDLGVEHAYVVGLSMGGMIAQALTLAEPGFVDALVLADTAAVMPPGVAELLAKTASKVRRDGFPDSRGELPAGDPVAWSPRTLTERPGVVRNNQRESEATDPDAWARAALAVAAHDAVDRLGEIRCPVLLVWGADDHVVPVGMAGPLQAGIPQAELIVLPDAGHVCNLEQPEAFDLVIEAFFAKNPCAR